MAQRGRAGSFCAGRRHGQGRLVERRRALFHSRATRDRRMAGRTAGASEGLVTGASTSRRRGSWRWRRDYVLSPYHPVGRFKARFFAALGEQHLTQDAGAVGDDAYGRTFAIRAILQGPTGSAPVVSVWFIRTGEDFPRFVTAYPGGSK
jgi:hypothetical protein